MEELMLAALMEGLEWTYGAMDRAHKGPQADVDMPEDVADGEV